MEIKSKNGERFEFRRLQNKDIGHLGAFFQGLSETTRSKYGPHPLTPEYASQTIGKNLGKDKVDRYIIGSVEKIVGYMIVDSNPFPEEIKRYRNYQIELNSELDPVFAPCMADEYQNQGIASQTMSALIDELKNQNRRSLVLMGGTQAPNTLAQRFYRNFGFESLGEFYTDHNGLNNLDMRLVF